jgi:hypothetical protein
MRSLLKLKVMAIPVFVCFLSQFVAAQALGLKSRVVSLGSEAKKLKTINGIGQPIPVCCPDNCDFTCYPHPVIAIKREIVPDLRHMAIFVPPEKGESFEINEAVLNFYSDKTGKLIGSVRGDGIRCDNSTNPKTSSTGCLLTLDQSAAAAAKKYFTAGNHIRIDLKGKNVPNVVYFVDARAAR